MRVFIGACSLALMCALVCNCVGCSYSVVDVGVCLLRRVDFLGRWVFVCVGFSFVPFEDVGVCLLRQVDFLSRWVFVCVGFSFRPV